jgi:hypothetical protein
MAAKTVILLIERQQVEVEGLLVVAYAFIEPLELFELKKDKAGKDGQHQGRRVNAPFDRIQSLVVVNYERCYALGYNVRQ